MLQVNARIGRDSYRRRLATVLSVALLAIPIACRGGGDGASGGGPTVHPAAVSVQPSATSVTTTQTLPVTVTITGGTVDGTITLTSGAFSSGAVPISTNSMTISVAAGVLATGADTLTVQYTPNAASANLTAASGTASITVSDARTSTVTATSVAYPATSGHPFVALPNAGSLLVSVSAMGNPARATGIQLFSGSGTGPFVARCTQAIANGSISAPSAEGMAIGPNGDDLAVAIEGSGIGLLSASAVAANCSSATTIVAQSDANDTTDPGTFGVVITPDGKYAFVANEYGAVASDTEATPQKIPGNVGVVRLNRDAAGKLIGGTLLGRFSTGSSTIANVTLSPDGSRLYVTSEVVRRSTIASPSGTNNTILAHGQTCIQDDPTKPTYFGVLSVIDVAKAEASPTTGGIIATVAAGCSPVRVVETADQQVIWVAARGDNRVLAFSTHMLETAPDNALIGYGDTGGTAPVGLALLRGDRFLAVANSNRFNVANGVANMTILAAIPVHPTVLAMAATGVFPRNITVAADDTTLYLTNYGGNSASAPGSLQVFTTSVVP